MFEGSGGIRALRRQRQPLILHPKPRKGAGRLQGRVDRLDISGAFPRLSNRLLEAQRKEDLGTFQGFEKSWSEL